MLPKDHRTMWLVNVLSIIFCLSSKVVGASRVSMSFVFRNYNIIKPVIVTNRKSNFPTKLLSNSF